MRFWCKLANVTNESPGPQFHQFCNFRIFFFFTEFFFHAFFFCCCCCCLFLFRICCNSGWLIVLHRLWVRLFKIKEAIENVHYEERCWFNFNHLADNAALSWFFYDFYDTISQHSWGNTVRNITCKFHYKTQV